MSPRRLRGKSIKEVELRITVEADRGALDKLKKLKGAMVSEQSAVLIIRGRNPLLVAKRARRAVQIMRDSTKDSERV